MKYKLMMTTIFIILLLVGCNHTPETYSLLLMNDDGSLYEERLNLDKEEVELPILEKEDYIFVGWDDGETNHYDSYVVTEDTVLSAKYELIEDVFDLRINPQLDVATILKYEGEAIVLKIPKEINGNLLIEIASNAFTGSTIEIVEIPVTLTRVEPFAFEDADQLREVSYYGFAEGEKKLVYSESLLESKLLEYEDLCNVNSSSNDGKDIIYDEGCPIISSSQRESVWQGDIEYKFYTVVIDLFYMPEEMTNLIRSRAFKNADALEVINLPAASIGIDGLVFEGANNLKEINIDERSNRYRSVDGILYSYDMNQLIVYPNGRTETTYVVPEEVESIRPYAFFNNDVIKEVIIHKNFPAMYAIGLTGMLAVEAFVVDEHNEELYASDGILYSYDQYLHVYPNGKTDTIYEMPNDIIGIYAMAFMNNRNLNEIIFSNQLEEIGGLAFLFSQSIHKLDMPSTILKIGYGAWSSSAIETIIIRRSLTQGSLPNIFQPVMYTEDAERNPLIYVPDDSQSFYRDLFEDLDYECEIIPLSSYDSEP